jgi:hypothetical protein
MAFNRGQPALLPADESIATARRFLDHPLSIRTDCRPVATRELLAMQGSHGGLFQLTPSVHLHQPYSLTPTMSLPFLVTKVDEANLALDGWFAYWTQYHGMPPNSFVATLH